MACVRVANLNNFSMKTKNNQIGKTISELKSIDCLSWSEIYSQFPYRPTHSLRRAEAEFRQRNGISLIGPIVEVESEVNQWDSEDTNEVWIRAVELSQRSMPKKDWHNRMRSSVIRFSGGPVCIVQMADLHLGSAGTDYGRIDTELETIIETEGVYLGLIGDIADNMIVGKLKAIRAINAEFTMNQEWAMVEYFLNRAGNKLLYSIAGNHDLWSTTVGIDRLGELHKTVNPGCIYEKYDRGIRICVGGEHEVILRARHKWKGVSQWNDTHAIEKASKMDKGRAFDIGVGGHTHVSGLAREFNNGGKTGLAVLCGSYKRSDSYANQIGFPQPNGATAVAVVFEDDGSFWGTSNLGAAISYMRSVY